MVADMAQERAAGTRQRSGGATATKGQTTEIELSHARQALARRMAESKATIPHLVVQADVDMQACAALRAQLRASYDDRRGQDGAEPGGPRADRAETIPTYEDIVIKACAHALREHPRANSSYRDGRLQLHARVNVGVTVWLESDGSDCPDDSESTNDSESRSGIDAGAPVTATVFDADVKSLEAIAGESARFKARARAGSITPPELAGATFTVSSLGEFGVSAFTAIINPPQAAILALGTVELRPTARTAHDGSDPQTVVRETLTVTLACDNRILDGADAAGLLERIKQLLEQPAALTP
jgi:pyruvate dehydrogenase E2 component (dihydrolipoamide acetyltransferase)